MKKTEIETKRDKIKMVLNNLEQKLNNEQDLCSDIARLIDMSIETNLLMQRFENIETSIPVIRDRIINLLASCVECCNSSRENIINRISQKLIDGGKSSGIEEYIEKIQKTIDFCIDNNEIYKQTEYNAKYGTHADISKSIVSLSTEELLLI